MSLARMESLQASNAGTVVVQAMTLLSAYRGVQVSTGLWLAILDLIFAFAGPASYRSAEIGRAFYDEERSRVLPHLPRHDVLLKTLSFEQFVEDMEPMRPALMKAGNTDSEIAVAATRVARSVENSGRWTVIQAAETDPLGEDDFFFDDEFEVIESAPRQRRGVRWARVPTGRETCGWCLMLASRGPVYRSAESAGGGDMLSWHTGCDCHIVPVFDQDNWSGRDRYKAAEQMWINETKGWSGRNAVNAMRRAAEKGKYQEYLSAL